MLNYGVTVVDRHFSALLEAVKAHAIEAVELMITAGFKPSFPAYSNYSCSTFMEFVKKCNFEQEVVALFKLRNFGSPYTKNEQLDMLIAADDSAGINAAQFRQLLHDRGFINIRESYIAYTLASLGKRKYLEIYKEMHYSLDGRSEMLNGSCFLLRMPPLALVLEKGNLAAAQLLLDQGCSLLADACPSHALTTAAIKGNCCKNFEFNSKGQKAS